MAEGHDEPKGLGDVLLNLPAVRTAKKVNTLSRVHRRLIEPLEDDGDEPRLAFQHTVFCQTGLPYRETIRMSGVPADRVVSTIDLRHFGASLTRRAYRRSPQRSRAPQTS